jgi:hypothetical protein
MKSLKGGNYKLLKGELKFENYLDILEDKDKFTLCRFRTTNHRLPAFKLNGRSLTEVQK